MTDLLKEAKVLAQGIIDTKGIRCGVFEYECPFCGYVNCTDSADKFHSKDCLRIKAELFLNKLSTLDNNKNE